MVLSRHGPLTLQPAISGTANDQFQKSSKWCRCCRNFSWVCPLPYGPKDDISGLADNILILDRESQEIEASAISDCSFCSLLHKAISTYMDEANKPLAIRLWKDGIINMFDVSRDSAVQFYSPIGMPPAWEGISISAEVSGSAAAPEAWSFIRRCLSNCENRHAHCSQSLNTLPTRLLDIGLDNANRGVLYEPAAGSSGKYAALSYCWGREGNFRTIRANIDALKAGIALSELPKTMQDAVHVARCLGIRYLWIDALCIIQDSTSDWDIESSRMASVYKNAFLTIAASSSPSVSTGFLEQPHSSVTSESVAFDWINENGLETIVKTRSCDQKEHHSSESSCPLRQRGWALQEEIMPTRLVSFCMNELEWKCMELKTCECQYMDKMNNISGILPISAIQYPQQAFGAWESIVTNYSTRMLRYERDRLPALAGVASIIQGITKSDYAAGIWIANCHYELGWFIGGTRFGMPCTAFAPASQAPTLSWVSILDRIHLSGSDNHRGVYFTSTKTEPEIEVIKWNCQLTGKNLYGAVEFASLQLQGHLIPGNLRTVSQTPNRENEMEPVYVIDIFGQEISFKPDVFLEEFSSKSAIDESSTKSVHRACPWLSTMYLAQINAPVSLLSLQRSIMPNQNGRGYRQFLVLGQSSRHEGCFERLGVLEIWYQSATEWPAPFESSLLKTLTLV